jgi:hypothetical protein
MAAVKKERRTRQIPLSDTLPDLLAAALQKQDDLIIAWETDPGTGRKTLHAMTGHLISTCMLNKLITMIETFPEDGGSIRSEQWK